MTTALARPKSFDEFLALPEGPPHHEFENGEIITLASPTIDHQDLVDAIAEMLRRHVRKGNLGRVFREVDVFLPNGQVYIPDIGFLSEANLSLINPVDRKVHGAPDLIVEVASRNDLRDRGAKLHNYCSNGVRWYWIIDSESLFLEEYRASPDGYIRTASVGAGEMFAPGCFPGLSIDLARHSGSL